MATSDPKYIVKATPAARLPTKGIHMRIFPRGFFDRIPGATGRLPGHSGDGNTFLPRNSGAFTPSPALPAQNLPAGDGERLLDSIANAARHHVVLPNGGAELVALFVLHTHAHDAAEFSPILAVTSPDSGCGKTTLLRFLRAVTPSPLSTVNITSAGLFRTISRCKHTLVVDEGDSFLLGDNELRGILNAGHCRDTAHIVRSNGVFDVWCPKIIALVGELPGSLRSRSLRVTLSRKRQDEKIVPLGKVALAHLAELRERAARWAAHHFDRLATANPAMPKPISNRAGDNFAALFAIADAAGGCWPELARRVAIVTLPDNNVDISPGVALLGDVRKIFNASMTDRIMTSDLVTALSAMEDRPWCDWNRGRPITPGQIAKVLKPWKISPKTLRFGVVTAKGYALVDFADAFARYL
jgi:hypothetical protein